MVVSGYRHMEGVPMILDDRDDEGLLGGVLPYSELQLDREKRKVGEGPRR